jgi:hypothetical protein
VQLADRHVPGAIVLSQREAIEMPMAPRRVAIERGHG